MPGAASVPSSGQCVRHAVGRVRHRGTSRGAGQDPGADRQGRAGRGGGDEWRCAAGSPLLVDVGSPPFLSGSSLEHTSCTNSGSGQRAGPEAGAHYWPGPRPGGTSFGAQTVSTSMPNATATSTVLLPCPPRLPAELPPCRTRPRSPARCGAFRPSREQPCPSRRARLVGAHARRSRAPTSPRRGLPGRSSPRVIAKRPVPLAGTGRLCEEHWGAAPDPGRSKQGGGKGNAPWISPQHRRPRATPEPPGRASPHSLIGGSPARSWPHNEQGW
jgi:hypothetical protein